MKRAAGDLVVLEMEEKTLLLDEQEKTVELLDGFGSVDDDAWIITDYDGAAPRFQNVDTPPKYAEVLLERQLQESGELDEGARILAHWKKGRGKTASQVFFTTVQEKAYLAHENRANELDSHYLTFPCNALLLACLNHFTTVEEKKEKKGKQTKEEKTDQKKEQKRRKKQKKTQQKIVAILFEHGRHVDLLLGRSDQVIGSNRVSSFADTAEAKASLSNTVGAELRNIMEATPQDITEIVYFNFLLPASDIDYATYEKEHDKWVDALAERSNVKLLKMEAHGYDLPEGGKLLTSLPEALQHLSDKDATLKQVGVLAYRAQQIMPIAVFAMLIIVVCLGVVAFGVQMQSATLEAEALALQEDKSAAQPVRIVPLNDAYKEVVTFVRNLEHWQRIPSYWMLLSELSSARVNKLFFDQVTIEFDENVKALMTLKGAIESSFQTANKEHEIFLAELTKRNFTIVKSKFATDVTQLTFELKLERAPE